MDHEEDQEARGEGAAAGAPLSGRRDDLGAEASVLHKETGRLLVQRRKIQARIKSLFKSILLEEPRLATSHGEVIEHELSAADENALHFEVWFPEFKQITELLVEENRDAVRRVEELSKQSEEAANERDRARQLVDALETGRLLMSDRLDAQTQELAALRKARAEFETRMTELDSQLAEARAQLDRAPPEVDRTAVVESEARLAAAEARYQELARMHERDRIENAREVASLTKQLTQVRERYESQLAQLGLQNERLTEALVAKEREIQRRGGSAASGQEQAPPRDAVEASRTAASISGNEPEPRKVDATIDLDAPLSAGGWNGAQKAAAGDRSRPQADPDQVVILDEEAVGQNAAADLLERGFPVTAFPPHPDLPSQLPIDSIACAVVNLALPETWTAVRAIAAARESPPAWVAYAAANSVPMVYWFGEVSFMIMPVEAQGLTRVLRRLASRLKQGIVISPDEQIASELSLQLSRARVTGAVARDRAQTLEVIKAIYPHVALAHLASSPVDVFRAVAALRNVSLFSRIPVVFMLDGTPHQREQSLFSAAARTILRLGKMEPARVASTLAGILGESLHIPRKLVATR